MFCTDSVVKGTRMVRTAGIGWLTGPVPVAIAPLASMKNPVVPGSKLTSPFAMASARFTATPSSQITTVSVGSISVSVSTAPATGWVKLWVCVSFASPPLPT